MADPDTDDTRDWVAIRRAYEKGEPTIKKICEIYGVSKSALESRYRTHNWLSRRLVKADRSGSIRTRLFAVLEQQVAKLANAGGETLGDKEAQQLNDLIKSFDKMTSLAAEEIKVEAPPQQSDMRELREKLIKRIDQFKRR